MIDGKLKVLVTSIRRLIRRGAWRNIKTILDRTHTADIAQLIEELDEEERLLVFKSEMTINRRSEIMSYLPMTLQQQMIEKMDPNQINQLVGQMASDDAADLLSSLQEDVSKKILDSMTREEKEEVQELMGYPEDSAGGIMSSEFVSLHQDLTVADAIKDIQNQDDNSVAFYIYITDEEHRLVGVLSLKQLLLSRPNQVLKDIMIHDLISVTTDTNQMDVAELVERYDFLSVPVLEQSRLVGVITVDDVIDVIREEAQEDLLKMGQISGGLDDFSFRGHLRSRVPWLLFTFLGGVICSLLVEAFVDAEQKGVFWSLTAFLPLLLSMSAAAGNQAATVTVEAILSGRVSPQDTFLHLLHELRLSTVLGLSFGVLTFFVSTLLKNPSGLSSFVSTVLFFQITVAMIVGTLIPLSLRKLNLDPTVSTVSIFTTVSNITTVGLLFGVAFRYLGKFGA